MNWGSLDWQVLYPGSIHKFAVGLHMKVLVRLRDDPGVFGSCAVDASGSLLLSQDFGDFSLASVKLIQNERKAAEEESRLRKARQHAISKQLYEEVNRTTLRRQRNVLICTDVTISVFLSLVIFFTAATQNGLLTFDHHDRLQAVVFAAALVVLWCCAMGGVSVLQAAVDDNTASQLQASVRAARPEFGSYQERGAAVFDSEEDGNEDWRKWLFVCCFFSIPTLCFICAVLVTIYFSANGHSWGIATIWTLPVIMTYYMCCLFCRLWIMGIKRRANIVGKGCLVFFRWPLMILNALAKCTRGSGSVPAVSSLLQPPKKELNQPVLQTNQRTIVFEGNVLPNRHALSSWPGKYESAWDSLVAGARKHEISAAVVFLPEGLAHYGLHDPIPTTDDLCDLAGECWCVPLYGEPKPWGCRWWSHWIANIEQAVQLGATLEVYFFNGKKGQGKVADFTAAGAEHLRRERVFSQKIDFEKSQGFLNALDDGLDHLSKDKGPDGSSPFSREVGVSQDTPYTPIPSCKGIPTIPFLILYTVWGFYAPPF